MLIRWPMPFYWDDLAILIDKKNINMERYKNYKNNEMNGDDKNHEKKRRGEVLKNDFIL